MVNGYTVLDRNFRTTGGELDLVAAGTGCIVFCEVRARIGTRGRTPAEAGGPLESIGPEKRRKLRRMAREWLSATEGHARSAETRGGTIRFDAIGIVLAPDGSLVALDHVENAF